jgi:hypothetical protein
VGLKLNGTHQLLVNAGEVNLPGDNIDTTKKNTETLIDASKEVDSSLRFECLWVSKLYIHHSKLNSVQKNIYGVEYSPFRDTRCIYMQQINAVTINMPQTKVS